VKGAYLSLPRTTIPTLSVSKLRAIPLIPLLNSTISPAWTLVRPKTLAIPSPIEMTVPNSFKSFYIFNINGQDSFITNAVKVKENSSNVTYDLVDI